MISYLDEHPRQNREISSDKGKAHITSWLQQNAGDNFARKPVVRFAIPQNYLPKLCNCLIRRQLHVTSYLRQALTLLKLQVAEVSLICTGWRRTGDYGEPRRFINMNLPLHDDDASRQAPACELGVELPAKETHYNFPTHIN